MYLMHFLLFININCVNSAMDPITLDLVTPLKSHGEACGYESCGNTQEGMLNVHIVPHTHYEYGFHRTFYEHFTGYETMFDKTDINMKRTLDLTITELWGNEKRKFTFADFPYFFHWWSQRDGTVRRMVYQLIRQGRLYFVGGAWGMPDEATTSYHAIIESFTYSLRKLNNTFSVCGRPLVAWQSDCYGHSREFTSLVAQMGFDGLFINPISFEDELARMRRMGLEFIWRGSDDLGPSTDIYTHKLFDGYWTPPGFCFSSQCTDPLLAVLDDDIKNVDGRVIKFINSMLNRQSPNYNTSHVMVIMGKVFAYFDATVWFSNIDQLIDSVNEMSYRLGKKVRLYYSTPACYLKAVYQTNSWFETKQDDFFPIAYDYQTYLTGFFTTHPSLKLLIREALVFLQMSKQLQVFANLKNNGKIFEEFGWIFSLMQDHSIVSGALRKHVKSYYVQKIFMAIQKSTLILKQAFNKLRESPKSMTLYRCLFNISSCENLNGNNAFIVIYNPLSWSVTIPVRLPVQKSGVYSVYDAHGKKIQAATLKIHSPVLELPFRAAADHEVVFLAENLPPLGYRCYYFERNMGRKKRTTLLKNLKLRKSKKYLTRQANTIFDGQSLLEDPNEYEYFDDDTTTTESAKHKPETKIIFGNISKNSLRNTSRDYDIVVPLRTPSRTTVKPKATPTVPNIWTTITEMHVNDTIQSQESETETILRQVAVLPPARTTKKYFEEETETTTHNWYAGGDYDHIHVPLTDYNISDHSLGLSNFHHEILSDTKPGDQMTTIGDQVTTTGNQVTTTGDKVTTAGDEVAITGARVTNIEFTSETSTFAKETSDKPDINSRGWDETNKTHDGDDVMSNAIDKSDKEESDIEASGRKGIVTHLTGQRTSVTESRTWKSEANASNDLFFGNEYIRLDLDPASRKISKLTLVNGITINLDLQFYYYISDDPTEEKMKARSNPYTEKPLPPVRKAPGAIIMRSLDNKPVPILDYIDAQVYKTAVVEEYHSMYADWASLVVRVYKDSPVVAVEWMVGPVPIDDSYGKEVFLRYMTDLVNDGVFYTDSNGRQTIKRIRNVKPMFDSVNTDTVGGNIYPVTSKIYIEDIKRNIRCSIFPDRPEGGTSLYDGELDLMLQRRILTDDMLFQAYVNETHNNVGIIIRGRHYLYVSKANYKPNKIFEKKFAKEVELGPQVLVSVADSYPSKKAFLEDENEKSFLKEKLPIGVHILTLQEWDDGTLLLRLENYFEISDVIKTGEKHVRLDKLFSNIKIIKAEETTLAANIWLKDYKPLQWNKKQMFIKSFNEFYASGRNVEYADDYEKDDERDLKKIDIRKSIVLLPQQIRTFVLTFEYYTEHKMHSS